MVIKDKQIAIIGGGPGGLTLARLLQQKGIHVHVYERDADKNVRQQGATLDLHDESGLKALTAAGLLNEFKANYRPGADKTRVTDEHGVIFSDDHLQTAEKDFGHEHFRPEIDRGPLRNILIASLHEGTVRWNSHITAMERNGDGWQLLFKDGESAYADLVVVAEGANSKLRSLFNAPAPLYSGLAVVEGNIYHAAENAPQLNALTKGGKVFALGCDKSIILSAKGDGSLSFYTGTKESEQWTKNNGIDFTDKAQVFAWFKERFSDWSPLWHELFASDESYFVLRPMYHFPLDQTWDTHANLAMIGDAAHRMPPYAGEGVNMAMLDALELYDALTSETFNDTRSAIRHFEHRMQARASEVTEMTLEQTEALHSPGALQNLLAMFNGQ